MKNLKRTGRLGTREFCGLLHSRGKGLFEGLRLENQERYKTNTEIPGKVSSQDPNSFHLLLLTEKQ